MKYFVTIILALFTIIAIAAGLSPLLLPHGPVSAPALVAAPVLASVYPPTVRVEVLDPTLQRFAEPWRAEVSRRFPDALVILVHGGDFVEGQWLCSSRSYNHYTLVTEVLRHYRELYPARTLVFLGCNTGSIRLHGLPNTFYALASVWCQPDRAVGDDLKDALLTFDSGLDPALSRWAESPDYVGNVWELVEAL
jgi:hypothetical protein